ncbi:hypothetical protein ACSVIJ_22585, partial [Pseudomonas sp. NCHU5208]|uniref:hypothetical protein n=1 Tax=unclassified Pseudomonas TaxID=196821 RepID=UPI003F9503D2
MILLTQRFRSMIIGWHGCSGPEVTPLQLRKAGKCPGGSSGCAIVRKRQASCKLQAASCKLQAASCKLQAASCKLQA